MPKRLGELPLRQPFGQPHPAQGCGEGFFVRFRLTDGCAAHRHDEYNFANEMASEMSVPRFSRIHRRPGCANMPWLLNERRRDGLSS